MKNYRKVPVENIKNLSDYVVRKIKEGHVIIDIEINDDKREIVEVISYANDKDCKSMVYRYLAGSDEVLQACVMVQHMEPIEDVDDGMKFIDIHRDDQDLIGYEVVKDNFKEWDKYCNRSDIYRYHRECYISIGQIEIGDFGGPLELDFLEEFSKEYGYKAPSETCPGRMN
ncbi:MAG: hypothetical protein ACI4E3_00685 [Candidatus Fimousia sp.]